MKSLIFFQKASILLTTCAIMVASNIYTLIPIYSVLADNLEIAESHVVLAGGLFTFFYACGLLSFGPVSDSTGRRKILVFGLLASAMTTLAVGFSSGSLSLWITRSLQGMTLATFASVAFAYSYDLFTFRQRTILVVLINTGFLIAGIFGQVASAFLADAFSWNAVYIFFAAIYFILFAAAFFLLIEPPAKPVEQKPLMSIFYQLFKDQRLVKCYVITFSLLFAIIAFYDAIGRFFAGHAADLLMIRLVGLIGAALSLFTGKLMDWWGELRTLMFGLAIGSVSAFMLLFLQMTEALILFSISFVSSISLVIPTVITLIGFYGSSQRAKALSLYSFILLIGASLAPPVAAVLPFKGVMLLLSSLFLFNIWLCFFIKDEKAFQSANAD
ncbi:MFS transporter [Mesobacillus boroniphilus]|uniref:MFS transporter n=1 Tax=Mesobacillus boroniphilus TaxID=308892 RepID=A0A944GV22_9BACI|nr:MFS transporter [Mesobacillus boroniphilus]MBS8263002.1 MFS transporter [Mesobacillus boroniphilus]